VSPLMFMERGYAAAGSQDILLECRGNLKMWQ
jgi:hypothetical protein